MARAVLLSLAATSIALMSLGCKGDGLRRDLTGKPWLKATGEWSARVEDGKVQVQVNLDPTGLFGNEITLTSEGAAVQVGPLAAERYDGQPLQLQPAKMAKAGSLALSQAMGEKREIRTKVIPGRVTVIQVSGAEELSRLTLPVRIDGVELLAMDYGWVMRKPGRFSRARVMTNFVLAEGKSQAVLLGADQSWRFDVDPAGHITAVALHRAAAVQFFVGVAPKGQWAALIQAYRKVAHPEWEAPMDALQQHRLSTLAGRMVVDDWSSLPYEQVNEILERLVFLGCDQLAVVRHNWQRYGYDVKLPDTWPPAERFGGPAGMTKLSQYCRAAGMLFGLHENFIDLYRDAPSFEEWSVAYQPKEWSKNGQRVAFQGWYNSQTQQQAVRHTPGSALRAMQRNVEQERQTHADSIFLDVTSYVDPEPCETEAGLYVGAQKVLQAGRELYAQASEKVFGPALGEGCTEKYLDSVHGANCDLWDVDRWGDKASPADWEYFPLLDWLAHDRVVLQGVGYPARYGVPKQAEFTARLYERPFLDNYNSTNVLFGHAPLYFVVTSGFAADPLKMAGTYWLGVPLHEVIGLQRVEEVSFGDGDIHRQHVRYANGTQVWVNRSDKPWPVEGVTLGQYGYLVKGSGIEQQLTLEAGQPFEMLRASDLLYVDFRGVRRDAEGIQADGAVLVRYLSGRIEIIPLAGNHEPLRVNLEKLGIASAGHTIQAERVDLEGVRSSVEVEGTTIVVPPQQDANPDSLLETYRRGLHKVVVKIGG